MEKNAILAAVLSIAVLVAWEYFYIRPQQEKNLEKKQRIAKSITAKKPKQPAAVAPLSSPAASPSAHSQPTAKQSAPESGKLEVKAPDERRVVVDVGPAIFEFTNRGAGMVSARLNKYLTDETKKPIELIVGSSPSIRPLFLMGGDAALRLNKATYRVVGGDLSLSPTNPEGRVGFVYRDATGLAAEKTFVFHYDSYTIGTTLRVEFPGSPKPIGISWAPRLGGSGGNNYGGIIEGPMSFVGEDLEYDAPETGKPVVRGGGTKWLGIQSKYFLAALIPRGGDGRSEVRLLVGSGAEKNFATIVPLPLKQKTAAALDIYVGPKETQRLEKLNASLEEALDYGKFAFIAKPLMYILRLSHSVTGNWGVAIILLTILIKLIFYPLTQVSMRNMRNMQKLQPKMAQLKEIYKDDKNKMNQEVMALYKEHKVNPMMGCLPMVIQIPVFFGLYNALLVSIERRQAPFFWWITDLSKQDPFHVFTILMGLSMFLQQKMTPTSADPSQAKMMMFMPVIFTGMFVYYPVPVGLVIYWFMNNALSIAQQYFVNRSITPPKLAEGS